MEAALTALAPVFCIVLIGYSLRRLRFLDDGFWPHAEKVTYYVFFPALLFTSLSTASFNDYPALPMGGALVTGILVTAALTLFLRRFLECDGPAFSSVFQGAVRMNTYVGIAGAMALAGDEGVTLIAIAILAIVPLVNLLCVPILAHFGSQETHGVRTAIIQIVKNPLILGCAAGYAVNASDLPLPGPVFETLRILSKAALPMGLMAVGAGLNFAALKTHATPMALSAVLKLLVYPLATAIACELYKVPDSAALVALIFSALPTASSSYILARQLGGDASLMAGVITSQTVAAAVTMPLVLYYLV